MERKNGSIRRSKKTNWVLKILLEAGVFHLSRRVTPNALTVLNYHRVAEIAGDKFYQPNISASPHTFARQMDYIKNNYNVISCVDLATWLRGDAKLPPHSAIITFDDGYYDNLSNAMPVLLERGLPAIVFLATSFMGGQIPFFWDCAAYCFHETSKTGAGLPVLGHADWGGEDSRNSVMNRWVNRVKYLPLEAQRTAIQDLAASLDVVVSSAVFDGLYLSWDQVRELSQKGIELGAHTDSHPILTGIPLHEAREELVASKKKIETETGKPSIAFAYPNGQKDDISDELIDLVKEIGFEIAFSLSPGPILYRSVKRNPYAIRRIFLSHNDTFARFVAKISGWDLLRGG